MVVIIDGLDETMTARLESTADIFANAVLDLPSNIKVFISSRTETEIQRPFSATFAERPKNVKHIHLDTSSPSSIRDVSRFLSRGILRIARQNRLDVLKWPGEERLYALCKRAAGLFIWAVTVIGFIRQEVRASGKEVLNTILDTLTANDLDDINTLYSTILRTVFHSRKDPWEFERFRRIVGCIVCLREPLCIADIALLLDLRNPRTNERVDVLHFIGRLRTVLVAGADEITLQTIPRLHKSFFEYIISESADQCHQQSILPLRVNTRASDGEIAPKCWSCIADACGPLYHESPSGFISLVNPALGVSPHTWGSPTVQSESRLPRYAYRHGFSHLPPGPWETKTGILAIGTLSLHDLQVEMTPGSQEFERSEHPFEGHTGAINCVSTNGKHLMASGSSDRTIILWDIGRRRAVGSPLRGHEDSVRSVAFSPDGNLVVSGSMDGRLRLWDVTNGQQIGDPMPVDIEVASVSFSADGKRIASGSRHKVSVWELNGREAFELWEHSQIIRVVAFSLRTAQPEEYIVSGFESGAISLYECSGGGVEYIETYRGHTGAILCVSFAPTATPSGSMQFISGSEDNFIRLWDIDLGACVRVFTGHTDWVLSVTYTSDSEHIVSGSRDKTIRMWDPKNGDSICRETSSEPIYSIASHDRFIVSSTPSGAQLWTQETTSSRTVVLCPLDDFTKKTHITPVSVSISSDFRSVATAFTNNNILVWIAGTDMDLPLIAPAKSAVAEGSTTLAFSPDGNMLAVIYPGNHVRIWSMATGESLLLYTLIDCIGNPIFISFSSDENYLLTFGVDGSHQIWDANDGRLVKSIPFSGALLMGGGFTEPIVLGSKRFTWYPFDGPDFGVWARVEEGLIRKDKNGVTTIRPTDL